MEAVREFIYSIMIVSVVAAAINMLAPDNSSVSRYVHFTAALVVTAILLSPMRELVALVPEIIDTDYSVDISSKDSVYVYADEIIEETCNELNKEIKSNLEERFSYSIESVSVICETADIEDVIIESVEVKVKKGNKFIYSDIVNYIENLLECDCEVIESGDG